MFGLIKLYCYKYIYGYNILFNKHIIFDKNAKIVMNNKSAKIVLGSNIEIQGNVEIFCNSNSELQIKDRVIIKKYSYIEVGTNAKLIIDEKAFINRNGNIVCMNEIYIGKNVAIGSYVSMYDHDHIYVKDVTQDWAKCKKGKIVIDRDVWIGANSVILRDVNIKNNVVIAASTLVRSDINKNNLAYNRKELLVKNIK